MKSLSLSGTGKTQIVDVKDYTPGFYVFKIIVDQKEVKSEIISIQH